MPAGVERRLLESMDPTRKLARIDFHGAHANLLGNLDDGAKPILRTLDQAAIALANEMVGGAQALLDSAVNYAQAAGTVRTNDRLVSGNQAQAAPTCCWTWSSPSRPPTTPRKPPRWTTRSGPRSLVWPKPRRQKPTCSTAAECIQIHGGIGFTWDNDTHLWFKRAKSSEVFLGQPSYHRELLMQRWGV